MTDAGDGASRGPKLDLNLDPDEGLAAFRLEIGSCQTLGREVSRPPFRWSGSGPRCACLGICLGRVPRFSAARMDYPPA